MPTYYIMDRDRTMAQKVAVEMPGEESIAACQMQSPHARC